MKPDITVKSSGPGAANLKKLQKYLRYSVLVGIPSNAPIREKIPEKHTSTTSNGMSSPKSSGGALPTNAEIAYLNEFGSPARNIPARPQLVPGIRNALPTVKTRFAKALAALLNNDPEKYNAYLMAIGMTATSSVQRMFTRNDWPAPAPLTIAIRKARGFKGTKPLIVTGQLRRAYTYVIDKGD